MSALLDSLLAGRDDPAAHAIADAGLPGPRSEAWKYTSLRALERRAFSPARPINAHAESINDIPAPRIVYVNGHFDAALTDLDGLPEGVSITTDARVRAEIVLPGDPDAWKPAGDEVFANLNALLAQAGVRIEVGTATETALHLVNIQQADEADRASQLHHSVRLAAGTSLLLVEHQIGAGAHANLDNTRLEAHVGEGATLRHLRMQDDAPGATRMQRTDATLAAHARYRRLDLELGSAMSRHELNIRLAGADASVHASGVLLADGRRHLDTRLGIVHAAADTRSELPWRGLADGRARVVFHGGIRIEAGADGSEANLQNRNLLLSDHAEIDTQPVLVIHADEVQAAHGATVGQLDATALFYLRSRGIPEAEARRILTVAFCHDVLTDIRDTALRNIVVARLDAALTRIQAA